MRPWIEPQPIQVPEAFSAIVGGHPLIARVLLARGIDTPEAARMFFDPAAVPPADPFDLPDMQVAVERIEHAIHTQEAVVVWGDFDVDGQTSTALLVSALSELGARVSYHIPVREKESHGVNLPVLQALIQEGAHLIITVDTGISAGDAVDYARSQGVDVVITDHHDLPPALPEACAVVNPKRLPPGHPLGSLPGVGVAYQLAAALFRRAGKEERTSQFLDLVALGIVADLANQSAETRRLLQRGLEALRHTQRCGLKALMELAEVSPANLTEEHIGFALGPRLNALGRLSDANVSVEFFTTKDPARARVIATTLEGLNNERKLLTGQVYQAALAQISRAPELLEESVLVLAHPTWPGGIIGIVASRLVERYHRPVVLISAPPGQNARGSARSIDGVNITAAIAAHQDRLAGFGGHPMAAGLSFPAGSDIDERIALFRKELSRTVNAMAGELKNESALPINGYLTLSNISLDLVREIERLAPFGPGNPPLTLASRGLSLKSHSAIGRNDEHLALTVEDESGHLQKVIWWSAGSGAQAADLPLGRFDLAYTVRASNYLGQLETQVEWIDARPLEEPQGVLSQAARQLEVVDYHAAQQPVGLIKTVVEGGDALVWAEAGAIEKLAALGIVARNRQELGPANTLVIWTAPPGARELRAVMDVVSPSTIYLVNVNPETSTMDVLLKRLAGLVKYNLRMNQGHASLSALAAACAQREVAVQKGLEWLAARGHITLLGQTGDQVSLGEGSRVQGPSAEAIAYQLKGILEESAAYRAYFATAAKELLVSSG
jgi:single-stranded-DNA-specific exonuclease